MKNEKKQKKSKEEMKEEKRLNTSVFQISKKAQQTTGILGIQVDDNVFYLCNKQYVKIYSIQQMKNSQPKEVMEHLINLTSNRFRLSWYERNKSGKSSVIFFLTVFFEADCYVTARAVIADFEKEMEQEICWKLNIQIETCSIENVLAFSHMNAAGVMKQFKKETVKEKRDWTTVILPSIMDSDNKDMRLFKCCDRFGGCMIAKDFSGLKADLGFSFSGMDGNFHFALEVQRIADDDKELFEHELLNEYNMSVIDLPDELVNVTYMLAFMSETEDEVLHTKASLEETFMQSGLVMMPCIVEKKAVFYSLCTMGLLGFNSMHNVDKNLIDKLLW